MDFIVIDIETSPLSPDRLEAIKPKFEANKNLRDPDKIAASIAEKEKEWLESAALSAVTAEILCAGVLRPGVMGDEVSVIEGLEPELLKTLWRTIELELAKGSYVVGFCITNFDLTFAARRSWLHGVPIPRNVRKGRYWADQILDLADRWSCGSRDSRDRISLDNLAKFLGIGAKNGDGAQFAELWRTDKPKAIAYLENDLKLTREAYLRMS